MIDSLPETCMLDVIEDNPNGMTLDAIANVLLSTIIDIHHTMNRPYKGKSALDKMRDVFEEMDDFERC